MHPPFSSALTRVALVCVWFFASAAHAAVPFEPGQRVLFLGDSITQDGRYVALVEAYLWAAYPELETPIINLGLSSETVSGLSEPVHNPPRPTVMDRIDRALEVADPDWVLVCYGMNDGIYHPAEPRIVDAYRAGLERLLGAIDSCGAKTVLLTPPVFDSETPAVSRSLANAAADAPYGYQKPFERYDETLLELSRVVHSFAADRRVAGVIDVHGSMVAFLRASKAADSGFVYGDGVHPPLEGHAAMAASVLIGLGEPEESVHRVLATITALRPPGVSAEALPADAAANTIREALFDRGGKLSAAYRHTVASKTPREDALEQAVDQAAQQEQTIRRRISAAVGRGD